MPRYGMLNWRKVSLWLPLLLLSQQWEFYNSLLIKQEWQLLNQKNDIVFCQICGSEICEDETGKEVIAVYCQSCGTTHHRDCWEFNKGCSTYNCGCTLYSTTLPDSGSKLSEVLVIENDNNASRMILQEAPVVNKLPLISNTSPPVKTNHDLVERDVRSSITKHERTMQHRILAISSFIALLCWERVEPVVLVCAFFYFIYSILLILGSLGSGESESQGHRKGKQLLSSWCGEQAPKMQKRVRKPNKVKKKKKKKRKR